LCCGILFFISEAGYSNSPDFGKGFNILLSKQNSNGTWNLEYSSQGITTETGKPGKWITLKVLRLLKLID